MSGRESWNRGVRVICNGYATVIYNCQEMSVPWIFVELARPPTKSLGWSVESFLLPQI